MADKDSPIEAVKTGVPHKIQDVADSSRMQATAEAPRTPIVPGTPKTENNESSGSTKSSRNPQL